MCEVRLTIREALALAGLNEPVGRGYIHHGKVRTSGRLVEGREGFSLLDLVRLRAISDLTQRAGILPTDALNAAEMLTRLVLDHADVDEAGEPVWTPAGVMRLSDKALVLFKVDGEMCGVLRSGPAALSEYDETAHVLLPIRGTYEAAISRFMLAEQERAA